MKQEDWTKINEKSHYRTLQKQDFEHRKLIKKIQVERDELKKQLALCNVSCQREQLSQYNAFVNMQYHGVSLDDDDIDEFNDWLNCN